MPKGRRARIKTPPLLYERTQDVLRRVQKKVRGTFLTYWTSTSGSVCDNDVMAMHELLREVERRLGRLDLDVRQRALAESDHNSFDALVSSLIARSSALGLTAGPPAELADRAVREGWIHIPTNPLSDLMNGG